MKISEMTSLEYKIYNMLADGKDPQFIAWYLAIPYAQVMLIKTETTNKEIFS